MQSPRVATREEGPLELLVGRLTEEEARSAEEEEAEAEAEREEEATKKQRASASIKEALVHTKNSRLALRSFLARTAAAKRQNATGSDERDTPTPTDATRAAAEVRQFTCVAGAKVHALTHACVEVGTAKVPSSLALLVQKYKH